MSNFLLTSGLAGGGDIQFSRPDFKIAIQSGTGFANFTMELDGFQHLRNSGMRLMYNVYDTTNVLSPSVAGGSSGVSGVDGYFTSVYDPPDGFSIVFSDLAPYIDMWFVDDESSKDFTPAAKDDRTFTAGNGGVAGDTLTVTAGDLSSIAVGDRIRGGGIPSEPDECWISDITGNVITFRQVQYFGSYPYTRRASVPSIAVANGSTITAKGRVNDALDFTTQVKSRLSYYGSSALLGMYGKQWSNPGAYAFHQASGLSSTASVKTRHVQNSGCTQYWMPYWDFIVPELYTTQMENISVFCQWWCKAKDQYSSTVPIFPLMKPIINSTNQHSYVATTTYLEYMIRCPQIDGCAFWVVNGSAYALPAAAPTWYEGYTGPDPDFPWMIAILDFIDKYGLSV